MGVKNAQILYVQVDRIDGEAAGYLIEELYAVGAKNVQLMPSLTKKGRPGYLVLIDVSDKFISEIERLLVEEFSVSGWHILPSTHIYKETTHRETVISITGDGGVFKITVPYKLIDESKIILLEHDCCVEIQKKIKQKFSQNISLSSIKEKLKNALKLNQNKMAI